MMEGVRSPAKERSRLFDPGRSTLTGLELEYRRLGRAGRAPGGHAGHGALPVQDREEVRGAAHGYSFLVFVPLIFVLFCVRSPDLGFGGRGPLPSRLELH